MQILIKMSICAGAVMNHCAKTECVTFCPGHLINDHRKTTNILMLLKEKKTPS